MENPFDAMCDAIRQARDLNTAVDRQATALAELLEGRLRHARPHYLKKLKKQLHDFNAATGRWKD